MKAALIFAVLFVLIWLLLDRVIIPLLSEKWANKTLKNIRDGKIKPRIFDSTIIWNADGLAVRDDKQQSISPRTLWSEVNKVTAFKRDLFTTDMICILIEKSDATGIQIHEEINDFMKFMEALPIHLPTSKPLSSWVWDVTATAFAPNVTEIYCRSSSTIIPGGAGC